MIDTYEYKQRLNNWNSQKKYLSEVNFLSSLLSLEESDVVLDYGCGTGFCLEHLNNKSKASFYGYDVNILIDNIEDKKWFLKEIINLKFTKIYLMHSIAHISNIQEVLISFHDRLTENGELVIITPNREFDEYFRGLEHKDYKPDSTVIRHYKLADLSEMISDAGYSIQTLGQFGAFIGSFNERLFVIAKK